MTDSDKKALAEDMVLLTINSAPQYIKQIIFQCLEKDLRFYRAACFSKEVSEVVLKRQVSLIVINIERDTIFSCLQSLDDDLDPDSESLN